MHLFPILFYGGHRPHPFKNPSLVNGLSISSNRKYCRDYTGCRAGYNSVRIFIGRGCVEGVLPILQREQICEIHVTSIDFALLSTFAPFWVYNDMSARKRDNKGSWLLPISIIPFMGPKVGGIQIRVIV